MRGDAELDLPGKGGSIQEEARPVQRPGGWTMPGVLEERQGPRSGVSGRQWGQRGDREITHGLVGRRDGPV